MRVECSEMVNVFCFLDLGAGFRRCSFCENQLSYALNDRSILLVHHTSIKWKQSRTTDVFWVLITRPWCPLLSWIVSSNPGSWVLPFSHFTEDNIKVLRDGAPCPSSQRNVFLKVSVSPAPEPLTTSYGFVLGFVWEACHILSAGAKGAHWWILLFPGDRGNLFRQGWADFGVEEIGRGLRGPGKARWAAWVSSQPLFLTADPSLRTKPPTQTLHNCLIWPSE